MDFESNRKEVMFKKYTLLNAKEMKAHKNKQGFCNLQET
jgi:hypothetical protein